MRSLPKTNKASAIIHCLVLGLDPESGEELPEDCVVNRIAVNRALLAGINALEQVEARNARRALLPGNVGRSWTQTEEAELREKFTAGIPIPEIAFQHGRTVRAIEARLEKAGLLTTDQRDTTNSFLVKPKKEDKGSE
jgi:hypothetical protein